MKKVVKSTYKLSGRVTLHLNGGFTLISGDWGKLTEIGIGVDIPTHTIPLELRSIGTKIIVLVITDYSSEDKSTEFQVSAWDGKFEGWDLIQEFSDGSKTPE